MLDAQRLVELFACYLALSNQTITRARAEQRMFDKLTRPGFTSDVRPLLTADEARRFDDATARAAFGAVFGGLIQLLPGEPWADTPDMLARFELAAIG